MSNKTIKPLSLGAFALGVFWLMDDPVIATPITNYQSDLGQVTNVNQLRDVSPSDWAYEALRSLVDRYLDAHSLAPDDDAGSHLCIVGFPNQTYGGDQALTRYEFAAGLNSCLNQIERLIASSHRLLRRLPSNGGKTTEPSYEVCSTGETPTTQLRAAVTVGQSVSQEDLDKIERLSQEFEAELATIGGKIDELESRAAVLEDNTFSTTTKLNAEIINYILGTFGDQKPDGTDIDDQITLSSRVRFNFDSSFTGEDRLRVRLQARNITSPAESGGNNALALNFEGNNDNIFDINDLYYSFPINERISALVGANGVDIDDIFNVVPTMGIAYDSLSLYSAFNNLVYDNGNAGSAALGLNVEVLEGVNLDLGYWATNPAESIPGNGLFNGNYATGANLNFALLDERLKLSLAYLRAYQGQGSGYDLAGFVGTDAATDPFSDRANTSNNYGLASSYQLLEKLAIGGYFGYTTASVIEGNADADILTWNAYTTLSDLFKEGSSLVVSFGQPPSLVDSSGDALGNDPNSPYLLNVEYQYKLNDYIQITPGGYALFNPNGNSDNDTIYVGTIRTIFRY